MKAVDYYMYHTFTHICPNTLKFYNLFSCEEISVTNNLCKFIKIINKRVFTQG
jgi:hypothetical protein